MYQLKRKSPYSYKKMHVFTQAHAYTASRTCTYEWDRYSTPKQTLTRRWLTFSYIMYLPALYHLFHSWCEIPGKLLSYLCYWQNSFKTDQQQTCGMLRAKCHRFWWLLWTRTYMKHESYGLICTQLYTEEGFEVRVTFYQIEILSLLVDIKAR